MDRIFYFWPGLQFRAQNMPKMALSLKIELLLSFLVKILRYAQNVLALGKLQNLWVRGAAYTSNHYISRE